MKRDIISLTVLVILLMLTFSSRAFFIDDGYHFTVAKGILNHPLRPYDFEGDEISGKMKGWGENGLPWLINPPLMHYFLALAIKIFGGNISAVRFLFIIFPIVSVISMYILSRRFTNYPLFATCLLLLSPAFLVTSVGLLIDSPLLCFSLITIVLFFLGYNKRNKVFLMLSSVSMGLVFLTKYTGVCIAFVILMWLLTERKETYNFKELLFYFTIPCSMFLLWTLWNFITYGNSHLLASMKVGLIGSIFSWKNLISQASFFSGSLIFPVFSFLFLALMKKNKIFLYSISFLMSCTIYVFSSRIGGFPIMQSVMLTLLIFSTVVFFYLTLRNFRNLFESKILVFWLIIALLIIAKSIGWSATRYFMILLPPACIIFTNIADHYIKDKKNFLLFRCIAVVVMFVFGIGVTYADYIQAEVNRQIAKDIVRDGVMARSRNNVFFIGNSFMGFYYYLTHIGCRPFYTNMNLRKNDMVLISKFSLPVNMTCYRKATFEDLELYGVYEYNSIFPIRVMNNVDSAGMYCSHWGSLPFVFSTKPLERFYLYVKR